MSRRGAAPCRDPPPPAGAPLMQDAPLTSGLRRARVQNNYIGTDVTGAAALPNGGGVVVVGPGVIIGGTDAPSTPNPDGTPGPVVYTSAGNVISGNKGNGVMVADTAGSAATAPLIGANRIGVAANSDAALGNGRHGVFLLNTSNVSVTGLASDPGSFANTIAYNGGDGVQVAGATSRGDRVSGNRIFSNGGLGIDLGGDGVTPNDPLDGDAGPNGLQNFPVITAAATGPARARGTTVQFSLHSAPSAQYDVEFFASPTRDPTGYGEGATF